MKNEESKIWGNSTASLALYIWIVNCTVRITFAAGVI